MKETVSLIEAAKRLGVSRRTIYYRIRDGRLSTIRTANGASQRILIESLRAEATRRYWRES